jgi:DNA-binding beta-propeller fold protein YncE
VSASSPLSNKITSFEEEISEIIKVIPFNNTNPSSITVDPVSNLVYVSVMPDYSYDNLSQLCSGQYTVPSNNESSSIYPCSVIYVLDGETDKIIDIIRLRSGEEIHKGDTQYGHRSSYG